MISRVGVPQEITRLDAKYMIRVAEERGLFGAAPEASAQRRKRADQPAAAPKQRRRKNNTFEVSVSDRAHLLMFVQVNDFRELLFF